MRFVSFSFISLFISDQATRFFAIRPFFKSEQLGELTLIETEPLRRLL